MSATGPRPRHEPPASTLDPGLLDALDAQGHVLTDALDLADHVELGRGAGGRVLRGPDRHLPRMVAWKIARGAHARARLEHEARALAALEHPAIVPIHDLVDEADGSLRIALRMVRGETLHVVAQNAASSAARLTLLRPFLQAVEAVAWAHRLGWIHRDLKPANIMVGELGETQVIDWGLAVCVDDGPLEPPGSIVGTAMTMSPEQARGELIDARADVWGLGATLYEVLVGAPLFAVSDPRAIVSTLASLSTPIIRANDPRFAELPPELVAILARALEPDPERRYPDAGALAKDLIAFLDGRVVSAHTYRPLDHLRRFVKAYRLPLGVALAVLMTAALAAVFAVVEIDRERDEAVAARQRADRAREDAVAALSARDLEVARRGVTEARRELADLQRPEAELAAARALALGESPEARGVIAAFAHAPRPTRRATSAAPAHPRPLPSGCIDVDLSPDGQTSLCGDRQSLVVRRGDRSWRLDRPYRQAALSNRGGLVLVSFQESTLLAFDAADGHLAHAYRESRCLGTLRTDPAGLRTLNRGHSCAELVIGTTLIDVDPCDHQHIEVAALDNDGVVAALCIGGELAVIDPDGTRRRVPSDLGRDADTLLAAALVHQPAVLDANAALHANDALDALVVGSSAGDILMIDLRSGHTLRRSRLIPGSVIDGLEASVDGRVLLVRSEGQGISVLSADLLVPLARLPREDAAFARVLSQGVLATYGTALSVWDLPLGPPARLDDLGGITGLALPTDDRLVLTHDSSATLIDPARGRTLAEATWVEVIAKAAVLSPPSGPEGHPTIYVAIAGRQGGEPLRAVVPADTSVRFEELPAHRRLYPLSDGRLVGARTGFGASLWPGPDRAPEPHAPAASAALTRPGRLEFMGDQLTDLAASDTFAVFLTDRPRELGLVDLRADPIELGRCPTPTAVSVAITPSLYPDEPLALVVSPGSIERVRVSDCAVDLLYAAPGRELTRAAATSDGRFVVAGTRDGTALIWRDDGTLIGVVDLHRAAITALAFDPSNQTAYTGAWDGHVSTLDLATFDLPRADLVAAIRRAWGAPSR